MNALLALALLTGLASSYGSPALYCDRGNGLVYDQAAAPWVAIDAAQYGRPAGLYGRPAGRPYQCGDILAIHFARTGAGTAPFPAPSILHAQALDAGYLAQYGIVVDIPFHLAPFSVETGVVPVTVINYSLLRRALE